MRGVACRIWSDPWMPHAWVSHCRGTGTAGSGVGSCVPFPWESEGWVVKQERAGRYEECLLHLLTSVLEKPLWARPAAPGRRCCVHSQMHSSRRAGMWGSSRKQILVWKR